MEGIPHREINTYTEENSVDLIIMGTHGRTGLDRVLVGSNTEKIVRTSEVPVMTVGRSE
ncbi:UspA domain protein [Candidatus Haloredivivus sp. G17]|nr:UspA domain protein [Candidatus Haloredivivus sp. G17]